ncbi:MAG TPA: hypothetical protein VGF20_15025 [Candidatus Acidoferrum sp.]|jgi:hypothetical protein
MQQESGYWWQPALQSAIHESSTIGSKIGLAKMIILGRLVSPAELGRKEEDALFEALDELRALEWQRLQ